MTPIPCMKDVGVFFGNIFKINVLTFALLDCFKHIFRHLKLELLTQFPASNDEKYLYFMKILIF